VRIQGKVPFIPNPAQPAEGLLGLPVTFKRNGEQPGTIGTIVAVEPCEPCEPVWHEFRGAEVDGVLITVNVDEALLPEDVVEQLNNGGPGGVRLSSPEQGMALCGFATVEGATS